MYILKQWEHLLINSYHCITTITITTEHASCISKYLEWNLSNLDTNGAEESVIVSEVSSFQRLQEWYLGWEKVSCLERCPQFRGVLIEREVPLYFDTCSNLSSSVDSRK